MGFNMRALGIIKVCVELCVNFVIIYFLFGIEAAAIITAGIALYTLIGEYIDMAKDGCVKAENCDSYTSSKLHRTFALLQNDAKIKKGAAVPNIKLHVIPDDKINAFAYGYKNIAVTRGLLQCCDEITLCAVMSHELSHTLNFDAAFHRIIFADITLIILSLIVLAFAATSFMWIVFLILCVLGLCGGVVSLILFSQISKIIKAISGGIQRAVLFIYRFGMGVVSRRCEYRADRYAAELGYGVQLAYFLSRFADDNSPGKSLSDILYCSHPAAYKRIQRLQPDKSEYLQIV